MSLEKIIRNDLMYLNKNFKKSSLTIKMLEYIKLQYEVLEYIQKNKKESD